MADVKLVASSHVSKTSHSVDPSRVSSMPLTEAPAFILPPRNLCIKEGATAKFEGRVRNVADWETGWRGRGVFIKCVLSKPDTSKGLAFLWTAI